MCMPNFMLQGRDREPRLESKRTGSPRTLTCLTDMEPARRSRGLFVQR